MQAADDNYIGAFSLNGELVPKGSVAISPRDLALVQGQAIFETLAIYEGRLFAAERHWQRLKRGADLFGLRHPDSNELAVGISDVMNANQLSSVTRARARVTLTAGEAVRGFENDPARTNVIIEVSEAPFYSHTATVITVPFARNEHGALSGLKTINYGENAIAMRLAREAVVDEAIFANTVGEVCEGIWSNFFCYLDREIVTPPLESGCLPGITRGIILELAMELGIRISERPLAISELERVDAAALTSTLRELQPVTEINGRTLPAKECTLWNTLSTAYQEFVRSSLKNS